MNDSFELLSSMSPKIDKNARPPRRLPTKLALKKHFRRSSIFVNKKLHQPKADTVILIESSSGSSDDLTEDSSKSSQKIVNRNPVVISDSNPSESESEDDQPQPDIKQKIVVHEVISIHPEKKHSNVVKADEPERVLNDKFEEIRNWVNEVNLRQKEPSSQRSTMTSAFTETSTISGLSNNPDFRQPKINIAINSTCINVESPRFDQLFKKKRRPVQQISSSSSEKSSQLSFKTSQDKSFDKENDKSSENKISTDIISNSLSDNLLRNAVIEDSFEERLNLDESLTTRINKKNKAKSKETSSTPENHSKKDDKEKSPSTPKNNRSGDGYSSVLELEGILDSIYGDSWKQDKDKVLPSSAPCSKNRKFEKLDVDYENNLVQTENKKSNKLLRTLQVARANKALETPWVKNLNGLWDSDSDTDSNSQQSPGNKIKFDNDGISDHRKNAQKTYTFLESLSASVPLEKCDVSARVYRTNFKAKKEELARKLFKLYNKDIFEGALPEETPIEWNARLRGTAGFCYCRKITRRTGATERAVRISLSSKVLDSPDRLRDTLVHELCHAATWIVNKVSDGHGNFWKSWANSAMRRFPELPPIRRCHDYAINFKYTYKCTNCGSSFGRHRKSIDLDKKCCAKCRGRLEVFINKTTKSGEVKTTIATPKKQPNDFALFVKDNYGIHKTPDRKHGDVMRLLGEKFSSLKVNK